MRVLATIALLILSVSAFAGEHQLVSTPVSLAAGTNNLAVTNNSDITGIAKQFIVRPSTGGTNVLTATFTALKGSVSRPLASIIFTGSTAGVTSAGTIPLFDEKVVTSISGIATSAAVSSAAFIYEE